METRESRNRLLDFQGSPDVPLHKYLPNLLLRHPDMSLGQMGHNRSMFWVSQLPPDYLQSCMLIRFSDHLCEFPAVQRSIRSTPFRMSEPLALLLEASSDTCKGKPFHLLLITILMVLHSPLQHPPAVSKVSQRFRGHTEVKRLGYLHSSETSYQKPPEPVPINVIEHGFAPQPVSKSKPLTIYTQFSHLFHELILLVFIPPKDMKYLNVSTTNPPNGLLFPSGLLILV